MTTLADFLLARIAEREATARDMQDQSRLGRPFFDLERLAGGTGVRELIDPARVLAECGAKRRIVALHRDWDDNTWQSPPYFSAPMDEVLSALALPYVDHPEYDEAWRT